MLQYATNRYHMPTNGPEARSITAAVCFPDTVGCFAKQVAVIGKQRYSHKREISDTQKQQVCNQVGPYQLVMNYATKPLPQHQLEQKLRKIERNNKGLQCATNRYHMPPNGPEARSITADVCFPDTVGCFAKPVALKLEFCRREEARQRDKISKSKFTATGITTLPACDELHDEAPAPAPARVEDVKHRGGERD